MTTETKHTLEPWIHQKPRGPQHAIDRKWEIVAPAGNGESVLVGEHTGIDCLTEANARRIVACVNACAGFSTEALESGKAYVSQRVSL